MSNRRTAAKVFRAAPTAEGRSGCRTTRCPPDSVSRRRYQAKGWKTRLQPIFLAALLEIEIPALEAGVTPKFQRAWKRSFSGRVAGLFEMEMRHRGRVNSAAPSAHLLKQAKPVFRLLATEKIGPPSASADGQTGEPGILLPAVNPRR